MKPLIRWTFGMAKAPGEEVLQMASRRFRALYPEFDYVICYNNLRTDAKGYWKKLGRSPDQLTRLKEMGVDLYEQTADDLDYPLMSVSSPEGYKGAMPGWGWKLCPPRLRPGAHELWVDNDLIIRERLPEIDEWLASDKAIIAKGHRRNDSYYGAFSHLVKGNYSAGFFGLPPHFDFGSEIVRRCQEVLKGEPMGYFDEQGLVSSIIASNEHIIAHNVKIIKRLPTKPFPKAMHFITTNRFHEHDDWRKYKCSILI